MPPSDQAFADAVQRELDHKKLLDLERELKELKADRDKFLLWGVIVLGGAVVGLVVWIFNLIAFKP